MVLLTDGIRGCTVREAARKIMGDVTIAYIEGLGGVRVAEHDIVEAGKNDVSSPSLHLPLCPLTHINVDIIL